MADVASLGRRLRAVRHIGIGKYLRYGLAASLRRRGKAFLAFHGEIRSCRGIEFGGPSRNFSAAGLFPAYDLAGQVDNVTFSSATRWEGSLEGVSEFSPGRRKCLGRQFILDTDQLDALEARGYDFLLSSHMLEHVANPLGMLRHWRRIVRPGGLFVVILPHYENTFDHRRPVTPIEHLLADLREDVDEADMTHLEEVMRLHDLARDGGQASRDDFVAWVRDNHRTRGVHHHVFDTLAAARLLDTAGLQLLQVSPLLLHDIVLVARNGAEPADNAALLAGLARRLKHSPFRTDRLACR